MLLRLLPAPTAAQANPPTILFTLPAPNQPYTARSLPLPPNLLAHRSVCLQEDIECPNALLGDKASWISGVIDDVTFSMISQTVTVNFIDGTSSVYPIVGSCSGMLHRVCQEVELSFAPAAQLAPEPVVHPMRLSSIASGSRPTPARRSPSSVLFSLLSPLLPTAASPSTRIPPARVHRRQARSILVDTFRRFVLPTLKAELPAAYLPWSIASETKRRMGDFEELRTKVDAILAETGVEKGTRAPLRRYRTFSAGSESEDDASSINSADSESSGSTPATSICSLITESPQSFLLSIPPAHALPTSYQPSYTLLLQRLTHLASRLHSITRLSTRYDKEESKRLWLEGLERGRAVDKALRRAWSSGETKGSNLASPVHRSGLWRSITAEDVERAEKRVDIHPAMMEESDLEMSSSDDEDSVDETPSPTTPDAPMFDQAITIRLSHNDTTYEAIEVESEPSAKRPSFDRSYPLSSSESSPVSSDDEDDIDIDNDRSLPSLYSSSSTESLSSGDWDEEIRTPSPTPDEEIQLHPAGVLSSTQGFKWSSYPDEIKDGLGIRYRGLQAECI